MSSRREFLKSVAITGACVPMIAGNYDTLLSDTKKVTSATHWGATEVTIKNGIIEESKALAFDPNPSLMNKVLKDRTYSETRVLYPYVREGFLKNGHKSDTTKRGKEKFIRVSWDEVNTIIYNEIARCQKEYGPESIYAGSYGWFGVGNLNNPQTLLKRMLNLTGGFVDSKGTYSTGAIAVVTPIVMGTNHYFRHTSLENIAKHTDNVILIGNDLYNTTQINWEVACHKSYDGLVSIKKASQSRKMNIISIDPQITDTSKFFNARNIQIKPGTDVALMVSIANYLYTNKLYSENFIKKYTIGFDKFRDYFMGTTDSIEKTPKWASAITGINEKEIIELAKLMVKGKTMLMPGWSLQRQEHGEQGNWVIYALGAMIGQVGTDGGGFGVSYHGDGNVGSTERIGVAVPGITVGKPMTYNASTGVAAASINSFEQAFSEKAIPVAKITEMLLNPGQTIDYNGKKVTFADTKLVYWAGGNPMHHQEDRNTLIKAWHKPQVIINQDPYWTASSRMADIVLPACTEIERDDISYVGSESKTALIALKKGIDPLGESKSDYEIFAGIAEKFGRKDLFTEKKDALQWAESFYAESVVLAQAKNITLPSFKDFWEQGYFEFTQMLPGGDNFIAFKDFIKDPLEYPLGTPSGKIEIFSKKVASYGYADCEGFPKYYEPSEYLGNAKSDYPFHLISPHPRHRLHSQLNNTYLREAYEVNGREPIMIHPDNAKEKGIKEGDVVLVTSRRGKVLAGAVITKDIRKDVVLIHEGAWYDPEQPGEIGTLCVHGDVNVLTMDKGTSKLAQGNVAHTALVNIEKFKGKIPPVKVFSKPALG